MSSGTEVQIATLLRETEAAHGAYERDNLGGNRDDNWAGWYAIYLFDRGIAQLMPGLAPGSVADLAALLTQLDADFQREQPPTDWPEYYARRLLAARP